MSAPAVSITVPYQEHHSRLTTFFRLPLLILPAIWITFWAIAVWLCLVVAWFALLITGRYPTGLYTFNKDFARYSAKLSGYAYLVTDRFPGFSADEPSDYPVQLSIGEPLPAYSRVKVLFRMILMIVPYLIAYAMAIVLEVGALLAWFVIVITGKLPESIYSIIRLGMSYSVRVTPYYLLLTETWPKFSDDDTKQPLSGPSTFGTISTPATPPADAFGNPGPTELPGSFEPPTPGGGQSS